MLFTLGRSSRSMQQAIEKALSRSLIFDDNVTPEQARADWKNTAMKCRAICGRYTNNKVTTGQVQGNLGGRHYVAVGGYVNPTLPGVLTANNIDSSLVNLGLEVNWLVPSTVYPTVSTMPKYGDGGYGVPGNTLMVYSDRAGYLYAHLTGGGANQYYRAYTDNPGGKYQTWTYTQSYSYCVMHSLTVNGVNANSTVRAPNNSSSIAQVTGYNSGPFVAFLRPAYSSANWGTYSTGIGFGNSTQQMTTSNTLSSTVSPSSYQDFPLSMQASGVSDEIVMPSWSGMVTYFADQRVFIKFDIAEDADIMPSTMTPGISYDLNVDPNKIAYVAPSAIRM